MAWSCACYALGTLHGHVLVRSYGFAPWILSPRVTAGESAALVCFPVALVTDTFFIWCRMALSRDKKKRPRGGSSRAEPDAPSIVPVSESPQRVVRKRTRWDSDDAETETVLLESGPVSTYSRPTSSGGSDEAASHEHAASGSSAGPVVHKAGDGPRERGAGGGVPQGALGSFTGTPAGNRGGSVTPKTRLPEGWLECAACGDVVAVGGGGRGGRGPACAGFIPIKV